MIWIDKQRRASEGVCAYLDTAVPGNNHSIEEGIVLYRRATCFADPNRVACKDRIGDIQSAGFQENRGTIHKRRTRECRLHNFDATRTAKVNGSADRGACKIGGKEAIHDRRSTTKQIDTAASGRIVAVHASLRDCDCTCGVHSTTVPYGRAISSDLRSGKSRRASHKHTATMVLRRIADPLRIREYCVAHR